MNFVDTVVTFVMIAGCTFLMLTFVGPLVGENKVFLSAGSALLTLIMIQVVGTISSAVLRKRK